MRISLEGVSFQDHCPQCNFCCWNDRPSLTILFTNIELAALTASGISLLPKFFPYKGSRKVFQVENRTVETSRGPLYVCPFYDMNTNRCGVYHHRPFDCRIWPFFFMRKASGQIFFSVFTEICPAVDALPVIPKTTIDHMVTPEILAYLEKYPELVWNEQEVTPFHKLAEVRSRQPIYNEVPEQGFRATH